MKDGFLVSEDHKEVWIAMPRCPRCHATTLTNNGSKLQEILKVPGKGGKLYVSERARTRYEKCDYCDWQFKIYFD